MGVKITSATFTACVVNKDALPTDGLPVVALVGRSNVGKSSLINTLAGRRELAKTSSTPGKTLTINFYQLNESMYLVDLPGYGYAKASRVTRERIQVMMDEFFSNCPNLKGIIQILDARHPPSSLDQQMHAWIRDQGCPSLAILTKTDKLPQQQLQKMERQIAKDLNLASALSFSAKTRDGREAVLDAIFQLAAGQAVEARGSQAPSGDRSKRRRRKPDGQPGGERENRPGGSQPRRERGPGQGSSGPARDGSLAPGGTPPAEPGPPGAPAGEPRPADPSAPGSPPETRPATSPQGNRPDQRRGEGRGPQPPRHDQQRRDGQRDGRPPQRREPAAGGSGPRPPGSPAGEDPKPEGGRPPRDGQRRNEGRRGDGRRGEGRPAEGRPPEGRPGDSRRGGGPRQGGSRPGQPPRPPQPADRQPDETRSPGDNARPVPDTTPDKPKNGPEKPPEGV